MAQAYVALGSNLHQPAQQIDRAVIALQSQDHTRLTQLSRYYRTAAVMVSDSQPDYCNAVCQLDTDLAPLPLLRWLLAIEQQQGRQRSHRNAARTLDLDLLCYEQEVYQDAELSLPHPRLHLRRFVLVPLCEIAPQLQIPGLGLARDWIAVASDAYPIVWSEKSDA